MTSYSTGLFDGPESTKDAVDVPAKFAGWALQRLRQLKKGTFTGSGKLVPTARGWQWQCHDFHGRPEHWDDTECGDDKHGEPERIYALAKE